MACGVSSEHLPTLTLPNERQTPEQLREMDGGAGVGEVPEAKPVYGPAGEVEAF